MELSLMAAYATSNRVIGNKGRLPWNIPKDLQWFKQKTIGKSIIMGRKTAESLGRALPNRNNIVITRNPTLVMDSNFHIASTFDEAIFISNYLNESILSEVIVIGGANVYRQALSKVNSMYLTEVQGDFKGDVHFPLFDKLGFVEESRIPNKDNDIKFDFVTYRKK